METSQSWIANIAILNKILAKESWYNTFFAKFSGNVDISKDDNGNKSYIPSGKPIEVLSDFIAQGRDNMVIPFLRELSGSPVYGDTVLKGTGEDQSMYWLRSFVNQYRKAVMKKSGSMSEQRQRIYKLYEEAKPQLSQWFTKWENQAIFQTFYEGVSPNLSTGTAYDGLGIVKRYHPNWYYMDDEDSIAAVGTEGKTKTNANLDTAEDLADDAGHTLSAATLQELRIKCMTLRIPQIVTKNGLSFWAMVVHPEQMKTLQQDSVYYGAQREAYSGKTLALPELSGAAGFYGGFALYEDIIGIRSWIQGDSAFFGTTVDERFAPTTGDTYNALVFGNSAIGKGIASDLHFTNEIDDHENTIEVGGALINGYNRAEYFTEGTAGQASGGGAANAFSKDNASELVSDAIVATNQSSLILMTGKTPA